MVVQPLLARMRRPWAEPSHFSPHWSVSLWKEAVGAMSVSVASMVVWINEGLCVPYQAKSTHHVSF